MRAASLLLILLAVGCRDRQPAAPPGSEIAAPGAPAAPASRWQLQASGEGSALALVGVGGATIVRLFCPARGGRLLVNVPAFRPVASEERMNLGSGGTVATLVADSRGDPARGGVTATAAVPGELAALLGGPVSINYGSQNGGPYPAPPADAVRALVAACGEAAPAGPAPPASLEPVGACRMQDGKALPANRLKAIGTEPFWGARIDGRCVTYSHPDDQAGTRIWTRFAGSAERGTWTGSHAGRPFVLSTRPEPGCSDGMSDNRYPIAVDLTVGGEARRGCASPL